MPRGEGAAGTPRGKKIVVVAAVALAGAGLAYWLWPRGRTSGPAAPEAAADLDAGAARPAVSRDVLVSFRVDEVLLSADGTLLALRISRRAGGQAAAGSQAGAGGQRPAADRPLPVGRGGAPPWLLYVREGGAGGSLTGDWRVVHAGLGGVMAVDERSFDASGGMQVTAALRGGAGAGPSGAAAPADASTVSVAAARATGDGYQAEVDIALPGGAAVRRSERGRLAGELIISLSRVEPAAAPGGPAPAGADAGAGLQAQDVVSLGIRRQECAPEEVAGTWRGFALGVRGESTWKLDGGRFEGELRVDGQEPVSRRGSYTVTAPCRIELRAEQQGPVSRFQADLHTDAGIGLLTAPAADRLTAGILVRGEPPAGVAALAGSWTPLTFHAPAQVSMVIDRDGTLHGGGLTADRAMARESRGRLRRDGSEWSGEIDLVGKPTTAPPPGP